MARDKKPDPTPFPSDPGAALFLELMMQMLAFFILLTSMAVIVEEKRMAALGSLAGTFSPLPLGANLTAGKGPSLPAKQITEGNKAPKRTAKAISEAAKKLVGDAAITAIPLGKNKIIVKLPNKILFEESSTEISTKATLILKLIASIVTLPSTESVKIEGYSSYDEKNGWLLSSRRSLSIFKFFTTNGIKPSKVIISGNGPYKPIIINNKISNKDSRRIELIIKLSPTTSKENEAKYSLEDKHSAATSGER